MRRFILAILLLPILLQGCGQPYRPPQRPPRPPQYYAPGTGVTVGALDAPLVTFTIGASHVSVADDTTKQVSVFDGGALVRTMPTSMGRGGTEKVATRR